MAIPDYLATAGQCCIPFGELATAYRPWSYVERPEPELPSVHLLPEWEAKGWRLWRDAQHILRGVTAEMLDWFWANMEKGFYLWAPGSHKSFQWLKEPWSTGFVGSAHTYFQNAKENAPRAGAHNYTSVRIDAVHYMYDFVLDHVVIEGLPDGKGGFFGYNAHTYRNIDGGVLHRYISCKNINADQYIQNPVPLYEGVRNTSEHVEYEVASWQRFLPTLYEIWADHPDPCQNVHCDLTVERIGANRIRYLKNNGPVPIE